MKEGTYSFVESESWRWPGIPHILNIFTSLRGEERGKHVKKSVMCPAGLKLKIFCIESSALTIYHLTSLGI
jgi:hypothetical protein